MLRDSPALFWTLGTLFLLVGALCVAAFLGTFSSQAPLAALARMPGVVMGGIGIVAGIWFLARSPATTVRVDVTRREIVIDTRGVRGRASTRVPWDDIASVDLEHGGDEEGNAVYRPRLTTADAAVVLLSALHTHDRRKNEAFVEQIRMLLVSHGATRLRD